MRLTLTFAALILLTPRLSADPLPGTKPLTERGDLARQMVDGIHKYLDRALAASAEKRKKTFQWDHSNQQPPLKQEPAARARLRQILGVIDARVAPVSLEYVATDRQPALIAEADSYQVFTVRWKVLPGLDAEGLLLEPKGKVTGCVVALPDADWTPEMFVGLAPGVPKKGQYPRHLAEHGCRVLVPVLIDRKDTWSANPAIGRATNQPHREFVYRMAYQMGRHIIGYEVQKVLAAVDWFTREPGYPAVGVVGYGEGGLVALYCMALDWRIKATVVSGHFGPREGIHDEPIYRNVWGLLTEFGDAQLASMRHTFFPIKDRAYLTHTGDQMLILEQCQGPKVDGPPPPAKGRGGAAPGRIPTPTLNEVELELARRTGKLYTGFTGGPRLPLGSELSLSGLLDYLRNDKKSRAVPLDKTDPPADSRRDFDPAPRQKRQFDQAVDFTQKLLPEGARKRQESFWSKLDTSTAEKYATSTAPLRERFQDEIIGKLPAPTVPMNPRTRLIYDTPKFKGYEVVLDLYEDVICYGILLVPNDIKPGEKRPVVVCQHGLEGRPTDVCDPTQKTRYYNSYGAQLAEQGYVVFAPQAPYIFQNHFRQIVRKAHPLKLSLYAFIVAQHERILDWLTTLPFVDASRIALYGLSYGGKVAMRIGALVRRYCVVICSGDFNEWIWKNITLLWGGSYMFTGEYDMYEFNLGNTFNYAEMAALIAPRPFMVERGHDDGVGLDEYVAFEYAKVRRLYSRLRMPERTAIEFFAGGHEIHGRGTFDFLARHLKR